MHVLYLCFLSLLLVGARVQAAIISSVPVTASGRHDATNYFQNLTYAPTGEMPGLERLVFSFTMEPLSYDQMSQTTSVRTTLDAEIVISDSYPARLRASISQGYCRYAGPEVLLTDVPVVTPANLVTTETSTDDLLCNQIYYATVALVKDDTTSVALTEVLNILHVSEENIPCIPFQLRCPNFSDYIYPPDAIPAELNVTRRSYLDPQPPVFTPYTNFATLGTWVEDVLEGNSFVSVQRQLTQSIFNKTILSSTLNFQYTVAPIPPPGSIGRYFSSSYNGCYPDNVENAIITSVQGGNGLGTYDLKSTCDQELYTDFRFYNGTFVSQSRQNALIMTENFGQLYQTISGFDGQVCVRSQLDCTSFTPKNAISNVQNHEVLVGDISFLATNSYGPSLVDPDLAQTYNSAFNPAPFFNPFKNQALVAYNISASIRRVAVTNETLTNGVAYAIEVGFDYNTTEPESPDNAVVAVRAFRNFCGVDETSPSFIGEFESGLLARGVGYKDQMIDGVFESDAGLCGQNLHLQIRLEARGTVNDIWLIALTYGKYTVHGNKNDRSLCIQYYVDCNAPIIPPGEIPVAPGYTGYSYTTIIWIAAIGWGSLLVLAVIIDLSVGLVFGPLGGE